MRTHFVQLYQSCCICLHYFFGIFPALQYYSGRPYGAVHIVTSSMTSGGAPDLGLYSSCLNPDKASILWWFASSTPSMKISFNTYRRRVNRIAAQCSQGFCIFLGRINRWLRETHHVSGSFGNYVIGRICLYEVGHSPTA